MKRQANILFLFVMFLAFNNVFAQEQETEYTASEKANAYYKKKNYNMAIVYYDKAIGINSNFISAYYNRGQVYWYKGDYGKALADVNRYIAFYPNYSEGYNLRGEIYSSKGEYNNAIVDFSKAIQIRPEIASYYNHRAKAYFSKKEYNRAWEDLNKAEKLGDYDARFHKELKEASGTEKRKLISPEEYNLRQYQLEEARFKARENEQKKLRQEMFKRSADMQQQLFNKAFDEIKGQIKEEKEREDAYKKLDDRNKQLLKSKNLPLPEFGFTNKQPVSVGEAIFSTSYIYSCVDCSVNTSTDFSYVYKGVTNGKIIVETEITRQGAVEVVKKHFEFTLNDENQAIAEIEFTKLLICVVDSNNRITFKQFKDDRQILMDGTGGKGGIPVFGFDGLKYDQEMSSKYTKMINPQGSIIYVGNDDVWQMSFKKWEKLPFMYEQGADQIYRKYGYVRIITTQGASNYIYVSAVKTALENGWKLANPEDEDALQRRAGIFKISQPKEKEALIVPFDELVSAVRQKDSQKCKEFRFKYTGKVVKGFGYVYDVRNFEKAVQIRLMTDKNLLKKTEERDFDVAIFVHKEDPSFDLASRLKKGERIYFSGWFISVNSGGNGVIIGYSSANPGYNSVEIRLK